MDKQKSVAFWRRSDEPLWVYFQRSDQLYCLNGKNPVLIGVGIGALVGGLANLGASYASNTLTRGSAAQTFGIGALAGGAAVLTAGIAGLAAATSFLGILGAEVRSGLIGSLAGAGIDLGLTALTNPPGQLPPPMPPQQNKCP